VQMHEIYNYSFFDEEFLNLLKWQPGVQPYVQNPVSENWRRLVSTLIPGLLKAVVSNSNEHDLLRYFESARVWHQHGEIAVDEKKSIAGIFYDKKNDIDFYSMKAELQKLWDLLKLDITWHKIEQPEFPWYAPYQTARLEHNGIIVGIAGKMRPNFLSALCPGDCFMFELNGDFLIHHKDEINQYIPISKYPEMVRDISALIPAKITTDEIIELIKGIDPKIISVSLMDFFEKAEWPGQKAMTYRFIISDAERTLLKEEADEVWERVAAMLKNLGAVIR
jgi:phenylalanyl-tRNA synthetase beta chain